MPLKSAGFHNQSPLLTMVKSAYKGQLTFSESQQQLVNSGNKIPFPKVFENLSFKLKNPNASNCVNSHKCTFEKDIK